MIGSRKEVKRDTWVFKWFIPDTENKLGEMHFFDEDEAWQFMSGMLIKVKRGEIDLEDTFYPQGSVMEDG